MHALLVKILLHYVNGTPCQNISTSNSPILFLSAWCPLCNIYLKFALKQTLNFEILNWKNTYSSTFCTWNVFFNSKAWFHSCSISMNMIKPYIKEKNIFAKMWLKHFTTHISIFHIKHGSSQTYFRSLDRIMCNF